ncbi:DNA polymerase zeta catalytic subunit [Verticillium alfalfae VaMs.102]|uniref:DNA polymerase n=1 Tax=Verticillium alfalfae (strain VaMs.102 / ATCC MYA-4576 / FGSC 10136) TaxID=526221 RepID=C9SBY7_VERA1|nr:DNA polymerase zeta catalytic subunit [Verticillium alfalfae VaMs.102]EEY15871.1 DNA polymerase zeta catalytic subunit [Verticillium alfalfae VaMs.102]
MDLFRVRLNCLDHYQGTSTRFDPQLRNDVHPSQAAKGPKVPIVRAFGSTETGQKVCAHIHGAFPYMYVEYSGSLEQDEVGAYIYRLHLSIDHALAVSYRRDQYSRNAKFVARITLVKGIPFYGFHVGYRFFLKIYMFNPIVMTRLADLFQQGVIMKRKFQPYEAHLQYLLQFMTDFNLYGCGFLDASTVHFRAPVPRYTEEGNSLHLWHDQSIPPGSILDDFYLPRTGLPGWIHEEEYREDLERLIDAERDQEDQSQPGFDTFVEQHPLANSVKTALQSVEDLFPANLMPALGLVTEIIAPDENPASSIDVDEQKIIDKHLLDANDFPNDSDEDWLPAINFSTAAAKEGSRTLLSEAAPTLNTHRAPREGSSAGQRGILRETTPIIGPFKGVCISRLTTGIPHVIPIPRELLAIAEVDNLVSKRRGARKSDSQLNTSVKRRPSAVLGNESKRPNSGHTLSQHNTAARKQEDKCRVLPNVASVPETKLPSKWLSPTFRSSSRPNGRQILPPGRASHALGFPVVKSQDDPNTKLRLSQIDKDNFSSSGSPEKHVLFNTVVLLAGGNGSKVPLAGMTNVGKIADEASSSSNTSCCASNALQAVSDGRVILLIGSLPPSKADVTTSLGDGHTPDVIYQDAYYSNESDVPLKPREYAGKEFRLESNTLPYLPDFDPTRVLQGGGRYEETDSPAFDEALGDEQRAMCSFRGWEIAQPPPSYREVKIWWETKQTKRKSKSDSALKSLQSPKMNHHYSQIDGPTPRNTHGFKYTQKKKSSGIKHEIQYMSTMSLEVHVNTRGHLVPDPEHDEVQCIFWSIKADGSISVSQEAAGAMIQGIVLLSSDGSLAERVRRQTSVEVVEEMEELDLFVRMVEIVRTHDPDILTGYEVHGSSWGYLIERARVKYDYDLCDEFSRMKSNSHGRIGKENDRWGFNTTSTIRVTGRHMINVWRAMRGELNLLQYSMENVVWHLLHRRIPHYSWSTLTKWYKSGMHRDMSKLMRYYLSRTRLDIDIIEANELIPRTSEQARLLGVDFFSVFSRGSQYKVESIMFRIAKPENFILVSPSRQQVGGQNALECLPLVMEPQSAFYSSPVLVLDFQSLYPSVMIAYNLCYSTFLGRITNWRGMNKMGFTEYKRHQRLLELLKDHINITPNGMMFAKPEIRKSLLAKMLGEILETRVMVKSGMKQDKDDRSLQQLLNNRQLALKLLANVTYGYTSASFSGRMPCSEIADSIVQTGRETLERAIAFIHSQERWNAEVVYGDTDSLFIHLKGSTKDQAFDIGNEIAKEITDMNPRPVKLKFEKVYHPCVLLAKKRYVGYKYESRTRSSPTLTPRHRNADLSQVKAYFQAQCEKIMRGAVSIQDFCFAKEVKLGSYSDKGPPPPGAMISTKRMLEDARAEPQYGERVPYVVVTGAPGARLIDRCVAPETLLRDSQSQLDAEYYISKNLIPPLERIFNLVGANVRQWYDDMPKVQRVRRLEQRTGAATRLGQGLGQGQGQGTSRKTLESYMKSASCIVCDVKMKVEGTLCERCRSDVPPSILNLQSRLMREEKRYLDVVKLCRSCAVLPPLDDVACDSKDCPVFYSRVKQATRLAAERSVLEPVIKELGAEAARAALEW